MYYSINGKIIHKGLGFVALEAGGVGYKLTTTLTTLSRLGQLGETVTLYTYLYLREDIMELYGFETLAEENCFTMLISVSGVGPKAAMAILSDMTPERFALAVAAEDVAAIKKAQGIGPKIAQRIILELKDKIKKQEASSGIGKISIDIGKKATGMGEALSALVVLGYSQSEAAVALSGIEESLPVEEMIKLALKKLALG